MQREEHKHFYSGSEDIEVVLKPEGNAEEYIPKTD